MTKSPSNKNISRYSFAAHELKVVPDCVLDLIAPCNLVEAARELRYIERIEQSITNEISKGGAKHLCR